jgi:hypothetical protein
MDETNRRYYKKVIVIHANLLHLCFEQDLSSPQYSPALIKPFFLDFMDLATVGIIDGWKSESNTALNISG